VLVKFLNLVVMPVRSVYIAWSVASQWCIAGTKMFKFATWLQS